MEFTPTMKWVLCQIQSQLGSFKNNRIKIQKLIRQHSNADLLIFPELFLMGYPPEDLLEQKLFIQKQTQELQKIKLTSSSLSLLLGVCVSQKNRVFNSIIHKEKTKVQILHKGFLATTDTFDEMRFFSPSDSFPNIINIKGLRCLILICEDLWQIKFLPKKEKLDFIICINSSPFFPEQMKNRLVCAQKLSKKNQVPLIYLNSVGGQDEWIFDGSSFVLNKKGEKIISLPSFKEETVVINPLKLKKKRSQKSPSPIQMKKEAICMGLKDFVLKNGFQKVHIGLSGGIDSALLAYLCVEVFGRKNVTALFLEGPFTQKISSTLSQDLAQELNISYIQHPIKKVYQLMNQEMPQLSSLAKENIQARIRNNFLMSFSNTYPSLWVGSSNKSELAIGYSTLYGDLGGALMPLGDLYKTEVYQISSLFYPSAVIKKIIKRKPTAELSPHQLDEDTLPPYKILDAMLKKFIEKKEMPQTDLERKIFLRVLKNEFKRRQAPLILKVSSKSFGRGRRYPITLEYPF